MALGSIQPLTEMSIAESEREGTRAETRIGLSAKRTSPFKSAGVSVQSTTGSRGVRMKDARLLATHSIRISPSLPLPCVTVCRLIPIQLYQGVESGRCLRLTTIPPSWAWAIVT
jgi:hypothetical protein